MVSTAHLTIRLEAVTATELASQAILATRHDVDTHVVNPRSEISDVVETGNDAIDNPLAVSLRKTTENLKAVMTLIDETAKVGSFRKLTSYCMLTRFISFTLM